MKPLAQQKEHTHYVQGVAWDPLNKFVVSQSCDRTLNIFDIQGKKTAYSPAHSLYKIEYESKKIKLFEDEKIQRCLHIPIFDFF